MFTGREPLRPATPPGPRTARMTAIWTSGRSPWHCRTNTLAVPLPPVYPLYTSCIAPVCSRRAVGHGPAGYSTSASAGLQPSSPSSKTAKPQEGCEGRSGCHRCSRTIKQSAGFDITSRTCNQLVTIMGRPFTYTRLGLCTSRVADTIVASAQPPALGCARLASFPIHQRARGKP